MTPIQYQNYMNMLDALGLKPEELSDRVNGSIAYLAMDEISPINNLCDAIRLAIKQSRGVQ